MKSYAKDILHHPILSLVVRVIVGGVFLLFGAVKAYEPKEAFFASIADYQIVPEALIPTFGYIVIVLEIIVGLLFILGLFLDWATIGVGGLLMLFIVALSQAMLRGLELPNCGCSGSLIKVGETPIQVLTRDVAMLAGVVWVWCARQKQYTLDSWFKT